MWVLNLVMLEDLNIRVFKDSFRSLYKVALETKNTIKKSKWLDIL